MRSIKGGAKGRRQYEGLRKRGLSKAQAARIANGNARRRKRKKRKR